MSRLPRVEINAAGHEWVSREWERGLYSIEGFSRSFFLEFKS